MRFLLTFNLFIFCSCLAFGQLTKEEIKINKKNKIKKRITWTVSYYYDTLNTERVKRCEEEFNREGQLIVSKFLTSYGHNSEQCWTNDIYKSNRENRKIVCVNINQECNFDKDSTIFIYNMEEQLIKKIEFKKGLIDYSVKYNYDNKNRLIESQKYWYDTILSYATRYEFTTTDTVLVKNYNPETKIESVTSQYYIDKDGREIKSESIYSSGNKSGYTYYYYDKEGKLIEILNRKSTGEKWIATQFTYETY